MQLLRNQQGHYYLAAALTGLERNSDALAALLHCVAVERMLTPKVHNLMAKVNAI